MNTPPAAASTPSPRPQDRGASTDLAALVLRVSLAFIWIWEGITLRWELDWQNFAELCQRVQLPESWHYACWNLVFAGELTIGLLLLVGLYVRALGYIQVLILAIFTIALMKAWPEFTAHPMAPTLKNVPLMGAALALGILGPGRYRLSGGDASPSSPPAGRW